MKCSKSSAHGNPGGVLSTSSSSSSTSTFSADVPSVGFESLALTVDSVVFCVSASIFSPELASECPVFFFGVSSVVLSGTITSAEPTAASAFAVAGFFALG